nr:proline-rich receptor-like protein kinase PERK4 [Aedes albopictus]
MLTSAKQPAPTKRADPNNPPQKVLSNSSQCSNAVTTGTRAPPKPNTMPPPANKPSGPPPDIPTAPLPTSTGILNTTRNSDGNDTDSSHASCSSNSSRRLRSKRSPPGKKMRRNDEANNEHGRGSQEEMQL